MNVRETSAFSSVPSLAHFPSLDGFPPSIKKFYAKNRLASAQFVNEESSRTAWLASHLFKIEEKTCIDGRTLDAHLAKGLMVGLAEFYRSAGGMSDLGSYAHSRRCLDGTRKAHNVMLDGTPHPMAILRLNTVHYSESRPSDASCAAWKHNTKKALRFMQESSNELNFSFAGSMVAVPTLLDTDLDAMTIVGPEGRLDVRGFLDDPKTQNGSSATVIIDRLKKIFPDTWEPLTKFDPRFRHAFHEELAERLVANLAFVRDVIASNRPIELLDHQERMVFVGRHADWISDNNVVFLIDDTDKHTRVLNGFEIALKYVAKNVILDAIAAEDRNWVVPVVINIPHDDDDHALTLVYTRHREKELKQKLEHCAERVVEWLRSEDHGIPANKRPSWLDVQLKSFISRVVFSKSVSHRRTRLFVPFD